MSAKSRKRKDRGRDRKLLIPKHNKGTMSLRTKISIGTIISLAIIFIAYLYNKYETHLYSLDLEETLNGLLKEEQSIAVDPGTKVAIGFGSCQDVIVQSSEVVFDRPPKMPEHFNFISNKEEFLKVLAYFYRHGAAAE